MTQSRSRNPPLETMGLKSVCRWNGGRKKTFAGWAAPHHPPSFRQYSVKCFNGLGFGVKQTYLVEILTFDYIFVLSDGGFPCKREL